MVHTLCHNVPKGDFCLRILPVIRYPYLQELVVGLGLFFLFFLQRRYLSSREGTSVDW